MWLDTLLNRRTTTKKQYKTFSRAHAEGATAGPSAQAGPIELAFFAHEGRLVHKWHHYLPLYDRYFAPYRNRPVRLLEIGVSKGGSLQLWRDYFGPNAIIYGIDIDPACAAYDGEHGQVRIGSQDDAAFLQSVVAEMGGVDIVLDDGSHHARHMRASLDALFPLLADNGIYMVEDLHCDYWPGFGGGYRARSGFFETVRTLIDDMHHWYHVEGQQVDATKDTLHGVHIHDSLVVFEKAAAQRPLVSMQPRLRSTETNMQSVRDDA